MRQLIQQLDCFPCSAGRGESVRQRGPRDANERVASADEAPVLSGADEALLARLRDLRRTISRETQVPAYVVFPDRALAEMAVRRPTSSTALSQIRGVGPAKLEKYGEQFLNVLRSADETEAA